MAAAAILEPRLVDELRQHEVQCAGALGEVDQRIELGDGLGRALQSREIAREQLEQLVVEPFLAGQRALARREHLVLEVLELGRDVALGAFQRLAADVVGRRARGLAARELDVEAVHAVVADFEIRDAGTRALARLEVLEILIGVGADAPQLVQVGVVARRRSRRRRAAARAASRRARASAALAPRRARRSASASACRRSAASGAVKRLQLRQAREAVAQVREIARPCRAQPDARENPLEIADLLEHALQRRDGARAAAARRWLAGGA